MVFCIDASGSVNDAEYNQQMDFVKNFIDIFSNNKGSTTCDKPPGHAANAGDGCGNFDGENGLKISVMNFAGDNTINIGLSTDYQAIKLATGRTESGETMTHLCLLAAEDKLRDTSQGARNGASKIIVLLTDGSPTLSAEATDAANAAKSAGTLIIGVGVDTGHCYSKDNCCCTPTATTPKGCCSSGDINIKNLCTAPGVDHYTRIGDFNGLQGKVQTITDLSCPVDCQGDWTEWNTCNKANGKQSRTFTVTKASEEGGIVCPTTEDRTCDVDCESTVGSWAPTSCTTISTQTQPIQISQQPKNNGQACPSPNTRQCSPCAFTWSEWTACNSVGKQSRTPTITSQPQNGGTACPSPEERGCATDCIFTWGEWNECDQMSGKYSKRRRSNVAVIIVRIIFISLFLFYRLLLNHGFPTNPNSVTNCFKLFLSITTLQLHCSCVAILIFEQVRKQEIQL